MLQWQKYLAEFFGTFILVLLGAMSIVASIRTETSVMVAVPFGFGLALLAGLYAFGEISGGHFNPAVTLAMFIDRRVSMTDLIGYWISQIAGGVVAALTLGLLADNVDVGSTVSRYGESAGSGLIAEIILTAVFVAVILAVTRSQQYSGSVFIAIALTLAAVHFASIPFSGASVNPARSFGPALVSGEGWDQLWVFLVGPLLGAVLAWIVHLVVVRGDTDLFDDLEEIRDELKPT